MRRYLSWASLRWTSWARMSDLWLELETALFDLATYRLLFELPWPSSSWGGSKLLSC